MGGSLSLSILACVSTFAVSSSDVIEPEYATIESTNESTILLTEGSNAVGKGKKIELIATVFPLKIKADVDWSSSNSAIATVNSNGVVKGKKAGTVIITASLKTNPAVKSTHKVKVYKKATKTLTVKKTENIIVMAKRIS